jgi:hypothetical protein
MLRCMCVLMLLYADWAFSVLTQQLIAAPPSPKDIENAKHVLDAWQSERGKVTSGTVLLIGSEQQDKVVSTHTIKVESTFNYIASCQKFVINAKQPNRSGAWVLTPDMLIQYFRNEAPVVSISKPTDQRLPFAINWDWRSLGFAVYAQVRQGLGFSDLVGHLAKCDVTSYRKMQGGLHEVELQQTRTFDGKSLTIKTLVLFNENKGYGCEKVSVWARQDGDKDWAQAAENSANWELVGGVWVPIHTTCHSTVSNRTFYIDLLWQKVGAAIPNEVFDVQSIDAPKGTLISDRRLSSTNPLVIGRIGETGPRREVSQSMSFRTRTVFALIVAFLSIALVTIILLRRQVSNAKSPYLPGLDRGDGGLVH